MKNTDGDGGYHSEEFVPTVVHKNDMADFLRGGV